MARDDYRVKWRDLIRSCVLIRDEFRCAICKSVSLSNHVHHIDNVQSNNVSTNLITLCVVCHGYVSGGKLKCHLSGLVPVNERSKFIDSELAVILDLHRLEE